MKTMKKILSSVLAIAIAITCLIVPGTTAYAGGESEDAAIPYNSSGLFLGHEVHHYDVVSTGSEINFEGPKSRWIYTNKLRMAPYYKPEPVEGEKTIITYPGDRLYLYKKSGLPNCEITSVKSNKSGLKCMLSYKSTYQYTDGKRESYGNTIMLKATKAGTYKVTVKVKFQDGKTGSAFATVFVPKKEDFTFDLTNAKFGNNGTIKGKSVKVKVKPGQKISGLKLYYQNTNPTAVLKKENNSTSRIQQNTWKKFKNGGTVKLNKNASYKLIWQESDNYYSQSQTDSYASFYPLTKIRVVYKDAFYGITSYTEYWLEQYKKY